MCFFQIICLWIIFFVDGKTINECRLVLHSLTVAVCQLYLALLPLRRAMRQLAECLRQMVSPEERLIHRFDEKWEERAVGPHLTNVAVPCFEGLCLIGEFSMHLLSVVSTLCVCARHVLQGALFLLLSTVRWAQQRVLDFKERKEEWEKKQERQRQAMQKEGQQVEELLAEYCRDPITGKGRRSQGEKTGHYL